MLDHGILNVPLSKRGDIDAQIDRFKAEQKAQKHQQAQAHKQLVAWAKLKVRAIPFDRLAELGKPHKLTAKQTRKEFLLAACGSPSRILQMRG